MVQLKALLPVLLEGEPDHAVDLPGLLEDLNLHGMYTDADLLFGAAPTNISSDTWHFLKTKIANFLSAEGSAADEIYQQETAHKADETNTRTHIDACNTGVESVDKLLGGGWTGEVVEILGDRGTGKTWVC